LVDHFVEVNRLPDDDLAAIRAMCAEYDGEVLE